MPVTTFLHDGELNQPTGDAQLDELLADVRAATQRDYQVVIHTGLERHGFLGLRVRKITRISLYVLVGGMGPWQWLSGTHTVSEVRAYLLGLLDGAAQGKSAPEPRPLFPIGSNWPTRRKREAFAWLQTVADSDDAPEEARIALHELHTLSQKAYPQPMESAPRDGTMVRLLVNFDDHATEDTTGPAWTIGANNDDNVDHSGRTGWQFAGWCWTHDHFTEGKGTPVAWLPIVGDFSELAPAGAAPEGMLARLEEAARRIDNGHAPRRIPADPSDLDLVIAEVIAWLKGEPAPFWVPRAAVDTSRETVEHG